jgi:insertion element IS1 protein InsB
LGLRRLSPDGWGASGRHLDGEKPQGGQEPTQKMERKPSNWRTRIKRLMRRTICFSQTTARHDLVIGLFINRYEFGVAI